MKITMTATEKLTHIVGVPVRLWEGMTEKGIKCKVFVHRIALHNDNSSREFGQELEEQMPPGVTYSLRHVL